jgi:hypothetical protein
MHYDYSHSFDSDVPFAWDSALKQLLRATLLASDDRQIDRLDARDMLIGGELLLVVILLWRRAGGSAWCQYSSDAGFRYTRL